MAQETVALRRYGRKGRTPNEFSTSAPQPRITYGKRTKALPLTGTQFRPRVEAYEQSLDTSGKGPAETSPVVQARRRHTKGQPEWNDSPLSEDDLDAVYTRDATSEYSSPSSPLFVSSGSKTSEVSISDSEDVACSEQDVEKILSKSAQLHGEPKKAEVHAKRTSEPPAKLRIKHVAPKALVRRLPVNELLLVPAAAQETSYDPPPSFQGVQTQDPIADSSSSPLKRRRVSAVNEDVRPCVPLTTIRKRLKTPKFTHRSVVALRKKHKARTPLYVDLNKTPVLGDGFDESELKVDHRVHRKAPRQRRTAKPLVLGFGALDLGRGPLPEVKFEHSSELSMVPALPDNDHNGATDPASRTDQGEVDLPSVPRSAKAIRRVSFSDRILEERVMAKLSSVSAPARQYSISSEEDVDEDNDSEKEDIEVVDEDQHADAEEEEEEQEGEDFIEIVSEDEEELSSSPGTPPSNQRAMRRSSYFRNISKTVIDVSANSGVSLDFLDRSTPGIGLRTPFNKRRLVEVNEHILDAPTPQRIDDYTLDSEFPPILEGPSRPRSILRNHRPDVQHSDTRPESTAANTRRNSMIDVEESRYFSAAADMLNGISKPRVTKSKTSDRHFSRQKEVQVPNSEIEIPETQLDYANMSSLSVLKRNRETGNFWTTRETVSKPQRNLRELTRNVSRDAGTLSQSVRRRTSMRFQSPMKTR